MSTEQPNDIWEAARDGNLERVKYFVEVENDDIDGSEALVVASRENHYDVVKYLLEQGADPDMMDKHNCTALHYADYKTSLLIIEHNADFFVKNEWGELPIHNEVEIKINKYAEKYYKKWLKKKIAEQEEKEKEQEKG